MSGILSNVETQCGSPLISVWWRPQQTIERIVAEGPEHLTLALATLGGAAAALATVPDIGTVGLIDWRPLVLIAGGGVLGVVSLYIFAAIIGSLGQKPGGRASTATVRAALAWGGLPNTTGIVLIFLAAGSYRMLAGRAEPPALSAWIQVFFGLWSMIVTLLMLSKVEQFGFWRTISTYVVGAVIPPILLTLLIRAFLLQPFNIPSNSMAPTLVAGDHFFVTKYAYGYSRYSFPFSPALFSGRILGSAPERGDVVVFRLRDGSADYVKRVVGLPGDRIQMKNGLLYINDVPVKREMLPNFVSNACGTDAAAGVKRWRETLSNGISYETLDCLDNGFYDNTNVYTVPAGHYFMLGDNRDNSTDSRVQSAMGYVPLENLIGRVGMIYFSPSDRERIGTMVR